MTNMVKYIETCPHGLALPIEFVVSSGREPSPTQGCICGHGREEADLAAAMTVMNVIVALGNSAAVDGAPQHYDSFSALMGHNSVVARAV